MKPSIGAIPDREMEQVREADVERTFGQIGWRPQVTLEEGLQRTLEYFRELEQPT